MKIGVLHPGAMGSSIVAALAGAGHRVGWCPVGRSPDSGRRAADAGAQPLDPDGLAQLDGVISVCPPHAATEVAETCRQAGFQGTYVDANAISPDSARTLAQSFAATDVEFVDGGIIGPPAWQPGSTRLYLSGHGADAVAEWFEGSPLAAGVVAGDAGAAIGAASALKMCYAAYTKGTSALLLAVRALADAAGVAPALLEEWETSQPGLVGRSEAVAKSTAPKGWRFAGEMRQIAATFEAHGLPGGFHDAAGDLYARLDDFKDLPGIDMQAVLDALQRESD